MCNSPPKKNCRGDYLQEGIAGSVHVLKDDSQHGEAVRRPEGLSDSVLDVVVDDVQLTHVLHAVHRVLRAATLAVPPVQVELEHPGE